MAAKPCFPREHQPEGFNVGINVGETAGQTIAHVHVHLMPRYSSRRRPPCIKVPLEMGVQSGRWLIGTVARQVIACAHCAVTVQR